MVYDLSSERVAELSREGAVGAATLDALVGLLAAPRTVWLMLPAGAPTVQMVHAVAERLAPGDVVIAGGNSHFKDDVQRAATLRAKGVHYVTQPREAISVQLEAKVPGRRVRLGTVKMDFCYADYFGQAPSTGYETLLYDCMTGDATLFHRADIVEAGWEIVEPILDAWNAPGRLTVSSR